MLYNGARKELTPAYRLTPHDRMEVLAVIKALEALKEKCIVNLYSDSKYVVDAINKGWARKWKANGWKKADKSRAQNVDLWERLLALLDMHEVKFIWVKGHADNIENERCDLLARTAIESGILMEDKNYGAD